MMQMAKWMVVMGVGGIVACTSMRVGPETGVPVVGTFVDSAGKSAGTVELTQVPQGVRLQISVSGLSPGRHGLHFHETGKCEGPDFKSAGKHFQGHDQRHGSHWGDLSNLDAGSDGQAQVDFTSAQVTLTPGDRSLLKEGGTSLIIHAAKDDEMTDPSGNSGDRILCAVISK